MAYPSYKKDKENFSNHNFDILIKIKIKAIRVHFNEYLRSCREDAHLTQEQLVQNLYNYDIEHFEGLDTTTLSKWERGIVKPKLSRQVRIIKYFQLLTGSALPCLESHSIHHVEELICKAGMKNLLGKSKELILNFPDKMIGADDLKVIQLRNTEAIDKIIEINMELDRGFNHKFTQLLPEHFKAWALHPSNSFFVCNYKEHFFGLLFTLRLKPDTFEKIIALEIREKDLREEDFASFEETGSDYIISFFAMNTKAATMLFIRYYAHLIANQKVIANIGVATMMDDARKLLANMNLKKFHTQQLDNGLLLQTYRQSLPDFLASEYTVKMILSHQECPEE
jgi:transcriptional regulator with XRE-family HTH domain